MAENTVDEIVLEIEASSDKADASLQELASALNDLKKSVKGFDVARLTNIKNALNNFRVSPVTALGLKEFASAVKSLTSSLNSISLAKGKSEFVDYGKVAKKSAQEIGSLFGLTKNNIKDVEEALESMSAGNPTGIVKEEWVEALGNAIWESRRLYDVYEKDYESFLQDVAEINRGATKIVMKNLVPELKEDWKDISKMLGKNFVYEVPKGNTAYRSAEDWLSGVMPDKTPAEAMEKILENLANSSGNAFKQGAAEINEFNDSLGKATFEVAALLQKLGILKVQTKDGLIDVSTYQRNMAVLTDNHDFYDYIKEQREQEEKLKSISQQLTSPLKDIVEVANGLDVKPETGMALQSVAQGFDTISHSLTRMKDTNVEQLKAIAEIVSNINVGLGELGSNNNISIRISSDGIKTVSEALNDAVPAMEELQNGLDNLTTTESEAGKASDDVGKSLDNESSKVDNASKKVKSLSSVLNGLKSNSGLASVASMCKTASAELNKMANTGIKALSVIATPFAGIGNVLKKEVNSVVNSLKGMNKAVQAQLNKMSAFWKRSMKTFTFMMVRKAITAVIGDMKTAIDSLALWSKNMGTPFNDSVSSIVADFKYMARSILTIVEPLINAVAPLIAKLADMFSNLAAKIASLMAALTGQSYFMKAKKNVKDYAASVDKASKSAKNGLQSFDELNNITTQTGTQDNPISGWKDEWEKLPVDQKAKELADKLKKLLSDLWFPIGEAWDRMKDYVLGGWKYMTGELKKLFKDVWRDFIEVWKQEATIKIFENIFGIIGDLEYVIGNLAKNFREAWNEGRVGKKIFENIRDIVGILVQHVRNVTQYMVEWSKGVTFNNLLKSIEKLTRSLKKVANFIGYEFEDVMKLGVLKFIEWFIESGLPQINNAIANVIDNFDFKKIRKDIQPVIIAVEKLLENLISGATKAFRNLGNMIAKWFNSDKFSQFTNAIAEILGEFTSDRIEKVLTGIGKAFMDIAAALVNIISSKAVVTVFKAIGKVIDILGANGIATGIKIFAVALTGIASLATSLAVVGKVLSGIAKLKFAWDVGKVATGIGKIGKAAKDAEGAGNVAKGLFDMKGLSTMLSSAQGMILSIVKGAGQVAVAIGAAIGGYFAGNKLGKLINPQDESLYDMFKIGGEGNWFEELLNPDDTALGNIKSMFDGLINMATDFKNNPVIAWLTSSLIASTPFTSLTGDLLSFKATLDQFDLDNMKMAFNIVKDDVTNNIVPSMITSVTSLWTTITGLFTGLPEWAKTTVIEPVVSFLAEKKQTITDGFTQLWTDIKTLISEAPVFFQETIITPVSESVSMAITTVNEDLTKLWNDIKTGAKSAFSSVVTLIEKMINGIVGGLNKFIPTINSLGAKAAEIIGEPWSDIEPFKTVTIPKFERGGFPEDGIFAANHNELVGQFSNGKTAVANNGQIIDGISNGVQQANAQQNVLFNQMIDLLGVIADKDLTIGDDAVFGAYQRGASRYGKRYGVGI